MKRFFVVLAVMSFLAGLLGCRSSSTGQTSDQVLIIASKNGPITEADLGIPVYPGASADADKSYIFDGKSTQVHSPKTVSVTFTTPDSVSQVEQFYKQKLGASARVVENASSGGSLVDITYKNGKELSEIQVLPKGDNLGSVIVILTQFK